MFYIRFHETFSTLIKVASLKKCLCFPPLFIRALGLCTQATQFFFNYLGITLFIIYYVIIFVNSFNVCVLLEATCSIIQRKCLTLEKTLAYYEICQFSVYY